MTETAAARAPAAGRRRAALVIAGLLAVLVGWDLARRPEEQVSARCLLAGIGLYRQTLQPLSAALGARCRLEPSCSRYGEAVLRRHGTLTGSWLIAGRLLRCGPWTPLGTVDPPS